MMTAKDYFGQAYRLDQRINSKIEQIFSLRELAAKATATISDMPRAATPNTHRMEDIICKIVGLEGEINTDLDRYIDLKKEIQFVIDTVPNLDERMVLSYRYIHNLTWLKIGEELNADERTVRRWHQLALNHVIVPHIPTII